MVKPSPNPPTIAVEPINDEKYIVDKLVAIPPNIYNAFGIDLKINFNESII